MRIAPDLAARVVAESTLEWKLTDPLAFGLATASPLQLAVSRIADGRPLNGLAHHPEVIKALGDADACAACPPVVPRELTILSGIRTGKSLLAACLAVHWALGCDVSRLREGEVPRVSVVSLKKDLADVVLNHIVGSVQASPLLSPMMLGEPDTEGLLLRHPSGRPIEIKVVAGSRAGSSLVSRWSAGCIFDEFPRMTGADESVVNWDDMRQAVLLRLLPASQLVHIGSPWAPYGPAHDLVKERWGKPTSRHVVIVAPAWAMNPTYWTPERIADAKQQDPDAYVTDVEARFASPEEAFFSSEIVDKCIRRDRPIIERLPGYTYFAAMDPATRGNGWTLAIATRENGKIIVVRAEEWIGSREDPLDPGEVLGQIAEICHGYGIRTVHSDQVMGDALVKLARQQGISLAQWTYSTTERAKKYLTIRTELEKQNIDLPGVPHLRTDLLNIRKRITPTGIAPHLPMTSDGRHCDWGPTLMLVLSKALPEPTKEEKKQEDPETKRLRELVLARFRKKGDW